MRRFLLAFSLVVVPSLFAGARSLTPKPPVEPSGGAEASVAASRDQYLAVWPEGRGSADTLFAARITPSGEVLDREGIVLPNMSWSGPKFVASDGERFLVIAKRAQGGVVDAAIVDRDGNVQRQQIDNVGALRALFWDGKRYVIVAGGGSTELVFIDRDGRRIAEDVWVSRESSYLAVAAVASRYVVIKYVSHTLAYTTATAAELPDLAAHAKWSTISSGEVGNARIITAAHSFALAWTWGDKAYLQAFAMGGDLPAQPITPIATFANAVFRDGPFSYDPPVVAVGSRFVVAAAEGATMEPATQKIALVTAPVVKGLAECSGTVLALSPHFVSRGRGAYGVTLTGRMLTAQTLDPAGDPFPIAMATPKQELVAATGSIVMWIQRGERDHLFLTDIDSGSTIELPTSGVVETGEPADATVVVLSDRVAVFWNEWQEKHDPVQRVAFLSSDLRMLTTFDATPCQTIVAQPATVALVCRVNDELQLQHYTKDAINAGRVTILTDVPPGATIERLARNDEVWLAAVRWTTIGIPEPALGTSAMTVPVFTQHTLVTNTPLDGTPWDAREALFAEAAANRGGAAVASWSTVAFFRPNGLAPFRTFAWQTPPARSHLTAIPDGFLITSGATVVRFDNDGNVFGTRVLPGDVATSIANPRWVVWQTRDTPTARARIFIDEYAPPPFRRGVAH